MISVDDAYCDCGDAKITIRPNLKGRYDKTEQKSLLNYLMINNVRDTAHLNIDYEYPKAKVKPDDELRIEVLSFDAKCTPCNKDTSYATDKKLFIKAIGLDSLQAYKEIKPDKKGEYHPRSRAVKPLDPEAKPPLKPEANPVRIYFKLTWTCLNDSKKCKPKNCERVYELVILRAAN